MRGRVVNVVRRGFYLDSVALMRFSRTVAGLDGVEEAALMMGTAANKRIMADAGLLGAESESAGGGDLIVAIRASTAEAGEAARAEAARLLDRPHAGGKGGAWRPRTIRAAVTADPGSNLALISVPGDFAAAEARKALRRGLHVLLFSDNVPLADEAALKREARGCGRLVMGADCGTAIINGVPLGFANSVPRGNIGIVGASGTGIQEISCLIARGGGGISHALGVGGRDLKQEVGGITTLMALDALDADPGTSHIVLVSKPPSAPVASAIVERMGASKKPFTVCFIGSRDLSLPANATPAATLKEAAESALGGPRVGERFHGPDMAVPLPPGRRWVRGLFSGGTLCAEAQIVFRAAGEAVASNAPVLGATALTDADAGHLLIDLGEDEYTRGRPHPMIDPSVRDERLIRALEDPAVGVVLLDVVIGHGAHDDPAGHLAGVLADRRPADGPVVVASVTGTDDDHQGLTAQSARLEAAGVLVAPSNADAAAVALACLRGGG